MRSLAAFFTAFDFTMGDAQKGITATELDLISKILCDEYNLAKLERQKGYRVQDLTCLTSFNLVYN